MAPLKQKGDFAELKVACDLRARGYRISIPFGEDIDYDLVIDKDDVLERVQVKYTTAQNGVIAVRCNSHSLTNGKIRQIKRYTSKTIDWLAVYEPLSDLCYYIHASKLGNGRNMFHLGLAPSLNNQRAKIHFAEDYTDLVQPSTLMEHAGLEPAASAMQTPRSPN